MQVLITGGCGFVGFYVAMHLREQGHQVVVMDNLARRGSETNIDRLQQHGVIFIHGDVRNSEDFNNLPTDIEFICDTSAQPSVSLGYRNPRFDITTNSFGVINVLEFARQHRCPLIFWSSNRVYGADRLNALPRCEGKTRFEWDTAAWKALPLGVRPAGFSPVHGISEEFSIDGGQRSIYGLSKMIADAACQEYSHAFDIPIIVNRFGVIAGPGQFGRVDQGWVVWWAIAHWFGLPLKYIGWKGKQVRDVLFLGDVGRLLDLQMANIFQLRGEVFNIGGGRENSLSLIEATGIIQEKTGRSISITLDDAIRKGDIVLYYTDNRKADKILGWRPAVTLDQGLGDIVKWIHTNEKQLKARYLPTC